jgi:salicylate hydroxylase
MCLVSDSILISLSNLQVFERSNFTSEVGAAVTISPNGTRVLRKLDFDFKRGRGVDIRHLRMYNAVDFQTIFDQDFGDAEQLCGAPHQAIHRQDLHTELMRLALLEDNSKGSVKIHSGVKIIGIDVQNSSVKLDNYKIISGDLLIGADGINSDVRAAASGSRQDPIDTEWQIYRFLLPREKVMNDEVMREMRVEKARLIYDNPDLQKESLARFVWYECRKYVCTTVRRYGYLTTCSGEVQNFAAFYRGDEDQTKVEGTIVFPSPFFVPAFKSKWITERLFVRLRKSSRQNSGP